MGECSVFVGNIPIVFKKARKGVIFCYYEFYFRYPINNKGELYSGFIASSSDNNFENGHIHF